MKPDPDYLKGLLSAFRDAPGPTTDIRELQQTGLDYEDPKFEFLMRLLADDGYIESDSGRDGIGLDKEADGTCMWSVIRLRLTATGHEFAEALGNSKAFEEVKPQHNQGSGHGIREGRDRPTFRTLALVFPCTMGADLHSINAERP